MLRTLAFACIIAICSNARAQPATADQLLRTLCPELKTYSLAGDDAAIFQAVAAHFKRFEWSPEGGIGAHVNLARHAVPDLKSPQVVFLPTIRHQPHFDAAVHAELQRHEVAANLAAALSDGLRARNADSVALGITRAGGGFVPLSCRDLFAVAFAGASPPSGDHRNASRAIAISLPAFDATRTTALVLAASSIEYAFKGKMEDMEVILLRAERPGAWQITWHAGIAEYMRRGSPGTAAPIPADYAVFNAVLSYLDQGSASAACVAIVNQTRTGPLPRARDVAPKQIVAADRAAIEDLEKRSVTPVYIGAYSPRPRAKLVQREAMDTFEPGQKQDCPLAIRFSLPGYGSNTATVAYTLASVVPAGFETGEGWTVLRRTGDGWRVDRHEYQRWTLTRHQVALPR